MRSSYIAAIPLLALLCACQQSSTTPSALADASQIPADQVMYGLEHTLTRNGVRSSVLNGDTAFLHEEEQRIDVTGVRMTFYDAAGAQTGTLTARTGQYDMAQSEFVAREDVVLVTRGPSGDRTVTTDELHYGVNTDQLWTDKPFVLSEGGRIRRGTSFQTDSKFTLWTARNLETSGGVASEEGGFSF